MAGAEKPGGGEGAPFLRTPLPPSARPQRYGRYVGLLGLLIVVLITINTIVTRPNSAHGVPVGEQAPPFAVPLAAGTLEGAADVATRPDQGQAGRVPACQERGPQILNICELYEKGPVALALFVQGESCANVVSQMQSLAHEHPGVRLAAVAIRGEHGPLRRLIREHGIAYPVGIDSDGALAALYHLASCPQVNFISRGGRVQEPALLGGEVAGGLPPRLAALEASSRSTGAGG